MDISGLGAPRSNDANYIRIGGLTTWTDVIETPLPRCFSAQSAAREVGSVRFKIQDGGGESCNAASVMGAPLLADAE
jgi:hypothetical protein